MRKLEHEIDFSSESQQALNPIALIFPALLMFSIGCGSLTGRPELPNARTFVRDQLVIHSNFHFPKRHRLVEELLAQRERMGTELGLEPTEEPIHIFLFENESKFRSFLDKHHPSFPDRRAFFLQSPTNLVVYAHWNARVAEDLRHEVAHGYLHCSRPTIPIWLDEGIAEYFETPPAQNGVHHAHAAYLQAELSAGRWQPNLERLESLEQPGELSQLDYAEAWLWVHFLANNNEQTAEVLIRCVHHAEIDSNSDSKSSSNLIAELVESENLDAELIDHLSRFSSP